MSLPVVRTRAEADAALAAARATFAAALGTYGPDALPTRLAALRLADLVDRTTN